MITVGKQKLVILWRSLDWNGRGSRSYSHGYNTVKWSTVIIQWVINFWSSLSRGGHKKPSRWALNPNSRICENYYFLLLTSSSQDIRALDHQRWTLREDFTRYHLVLSILSYSPILSEFDSLIMAAFWDLSFASLPPSPEWAPFWSSLFEGALSAFFIWLIAQNGPTRTSAFWINMLFINPCVSIRLCDSVCLPRWLAETICDRVLWPNNCCFIVYGCCLYLLWWTGSSLWQFSANALLGERKGLIEMRNIDGNDSMILFYTLSFCALHSSRNQLVA